MQDNALYYGDCLDWMREWPAGSVDLIYLDPPFNSNADYNIIFGTGNGTPAQVRGFIDTWKWDARAAERVGEIERAVSHPLHEVTIGLRRILGESGMLAYLSYMGLRLVEMRRLLKPTGSIYLHCDPTASHYLKVVMDAIFGTNCFQNEFVWYYSGGGASKRRWARKHDIVLFYSRGPEWTFNADAVRVPYKWDRGQKRADGSERDSEKGKLADDVWEHHSLMPWAKERLDYPTQKPVALLERIIGASSNPGDLVLDPFCGCGTSVVAAHNLGRRWIGIDISANAIDIIQDRRLQPLRITAPAFGIPQDLASARKLAEKPFDFEGWAVTRIPGMALNEHQRGDGGIDGRGMLLAAPADHDSSLALAQVKSGAGFALADLRDFLHVVNRENAALGVFITMNPVTSRAARAEAAAMGEVTVGAERYPRVQLWSIKDYFEGRRPELPSLADPWTGGEMHTAPRMFG